MCVICGLVGDAEDGESRQKKNREVQREIATQKGDRKNV
jgi:hypothetical protein